MTELSSHIRERVVDCLTSLQDARTQGDDYLAQIREDELENLSRLAEEHGLVIPELRRHGLA